MGQERRGGQEGQDETEWPSCRSSLSCPSCLVLRNWRFVCGEREQDTQADGEDRREYYPERTDESESAGLPESEGGAHDQEKVANQVKVDEAHLRDG